MLRTNLGELNVRHLDELSQAYLQEFLRQHPNHKYLEKNKNYKFIQFDVLINSIIRYEFTLSHSILYRERKPGKTGGRFEVINKKEVLGVGAEGVVYPSDGVLIPKLGFFEFKNKSRAIKESNETVIKREYAAAKLTNHVHAKPPTFFNNKGYMANRLMPGCNLYDIIESEKSGQILIMIDQRIDLSIAILKAINEIHSRGIIHRDIKPENIMVDIATNEINIIDFSMSKIINDPHSLPEPGGTILMMPIEQFFEDGFGYPLYSLKSDSYSIGKSLAELWWAEPYVNIKANDYHDRDEIEELFYTHAQQDTKFDYSHFLSGDLTGLQRTQVQKIFEGLCCAHPDDRWSIDRALEVLLRIREERKLDAAHRKSMDTKIAERLRAYYAADGKMP